ncbi:putative skeletal organic matrix protein 8 [Oculina patagonica]
MSPRALLFIATFCLFWAPLETIVQGIRPIPRNARAFTNTLKSFRRPPGPLGYFNSLYMAFTLEEAQQFPDLVSFHAKMRKMKSGELASVFSIWNQTHIKHATFNNSGFQNAPSIKRNNKRGKNYKRNPSYPITVITGPCETTIGGLNRLCKVCPAITDLGPDKIPRYINELLCDGYELCGIGSVVGLCQNTVLNQDFLVIQNLITQVYSQPIRVCCECSLFP